MSDWMDLQLAHSLAPVKAPEALWARLDARLSAGDAAGGRPRSRRLAGPAPWRGTFRWAAPAFAAAAILLLVVRASTIELRRAHPEFVSNDPVAVERWLAHEAGVAVPLRPAPGVALKSARVLRSGVVAVAYEVNGRTETVTLSASSGPMPVTVAANASRATDAACRACHSL